MLHAQINQLLLNDKLADATAYLREDIKKTYHHFEDATVAKLVAERGSNSVSELELERSSPGLFNAMTQRLGQADATLLRRAVALGADKKSATDDELKVRLRERARSMKYGPMPRDYIAALRDGREPGDLIALDLLASLLHLRVWLLREDGSVEKEIKCKAPVAALHLLPVDDTFCTLIVPDLHLEGVKQVTPLDSVPKPPQAFVWPRVGKRMEVEVNGFGWCPAKVITVLADGGQFLMRVTSTDGEVWDDWFTWQDENKDWRRPESSPPTQPVDASVTPHAGSGGEDRPSRAGRAISAAAAINSVVIGGEGGGEGGSEGGEGGSGEGGGGEGGGGGGEGGGDGQATTTPPDVQALPLQYFHEPVSSGHCVWSLVYKPPEVELMSLPTSQTELVAKKR